jgi:hypothetical protein
MVPSRSCCGHLVVGFAKKGVDEVGCVELL